MILHELYQLKSDSIQQEQKRKLDDVSRRIRKQQNNKTNTIPQNKTGQTGVSYNKSNSNQYQFY